MKQASAYEEANLIDKAVLAARSALDCDLLNETAHRLLMRLYSHAGDRVAAIKQYELCCDALQSELGIKPDTQTRKLYAGILDETGQEAVAAPLPHDTTSQASAEKPTIAVLPFDNISNDPQQDYFADGLTEDITTELSRFRDLFVIANNSASAYRGQGLDFKSVSRSLGVRYILQGSVQQAGDRYRISAQLVDGETGQHLWTERYDRAAGDLFELRDEVTETIVATLASGYGGRLRKAWQRGAKGARPQDDRAFDFFMRGLDAVDLFTKEGVERGRELFNEAIRLDPGYAKAHSKQAWTHFLSAIEGWGTNPGAALDRGRDCALKGIECDDGESRAYWSLGSYYIYIGRHDAGLAEYEKALEINPNDADVMTDYGTFLSYAGHSEQGLAVALKAMRLNPHYLEWYVQQLAQVYFDARQYEKSVETHGKLTTMHTGLSEAYLAASHAALGNQKQAGQAVERLLQFDPCATAEKWTTPYLAHYKRYEDQEHLHINLIKAGLPATPDATKPAKKVRHVAQ